MEKRLPQVSMPLDRHLSIDGFVRRPAQYVPRIVPAEPATISVPQPSELELTPVLTPPKRPLRFALKQWSVQGVVLAVPILVAVGTGMLIHLRGVSGEHIQPTARVSALPAPVTRVEPVAPPAPAPALPDYIGHMNAAIATRPDLSASASLVDLDSGQEYNAGNYTARYEAASTSKLVAVFDYIHQVELGKASLTQSIQGQQAQDIIMRMIVYSDNNAWAKLNGYLKFKQEQTYINSLGLTAIFRPDNIQFSTPDMAKLLQMLYQGKLMDSAHQAMVYNYMANTTVKNLIQAVLPADAVVYHKYGQVDGVLHDASIVEYQGHHFILVIYTNNSAGTSSKYTEQVDLIHTITTAVFSDVTAP